MGCDDMAVKNKKSEENNKMSEKKEKRNYVKNYFILLVVFVVCIAFVFYLKEQYEVYEKYKKEIPVIGDTLSNITREDVEHYVVDNSNVILYLCTASDESCRSFEKSFKRYVEKKELTDEIVYLNLSDADNNDFVNYFNERFNYKTKLKGIYPAFVVFSDGNVEAILQSTKKKSLTISKVQTFLELYMLDEDDEEYDEANEDSQ